MREIKFRAWVKNPATVLPGESRMLQWDGMYGICRCDSKDGTTSVAVHVAIADQCYLLPDDIVLMQFTGLKDKNGKEIYEGDIVHYWHEWWNTGGMGEYKTGLVTFQSGAFVVHGKTRHVEVIGNVYENPELIKEQP